jgi:aspartyl-tRNA(Asn)/glutamyl-tRNA(Gln) amidotransferase subunit A
VSAVEGYAPRNVASLRNTVVGNVLGLCGITLPVGLDASGMPVGLQLLGKHGSDAKLLSMACRIEKILGTSRQRLGIAPCFK